MAEIDTDKLKRTFLRLKRELNEHLDAINENSNEIEANFACIRELEQKIDKLNEKLEEIILIVGPKKEGQAGYSLPANGRIELTFREQEIFLILYTAEDYLSYPDMAKKQGISPTLVGSYVTRLMEKGVPVQKKYVNKEPRVMLDAKFRELQAKQSIIAIDRRVAQQNN